MTPRAKKTKAALAGHGLRVASFFSGAGGLDIGFEQAGFEVIFACELEKVFCDTLCVNKGRFLNKQLVVKEADIRQLDPAEVPGQIDLVIGGPPCQSFSASGRRAGGAAGTLDQRGTLFEAYCRIIKAVKPRAFVFENVRGILSTNGGADWKSIVQTFGDAGYHVSYRVLDALDYGAPQQRERMLLVGHRHNGVFLFPEPMFGPDSHSKRPHVTAGQALEGVRHDEDLKPLFMREGKYAHLLPLVPPGGNYLCFTSMRGCEQPVFAYRSRFSDFLYKADPDAPVKTLIARPGKYTGPFHWDNRRFSVAEYALLQGFPDGYKFAGKRDDAIRQIGNSVSPKLAYQMALAIAQQVFGRAAEVRLLPQDTALTFDKRKSHKARQTRTLHSAVAVREGHGRMAMFRMESYQSSIGPRSASTPADNVRVRVQDGLLKMNVMTDASSAPAAKMRIIVRALERSLFAEFDAPQAELEVTVRGHGDHVIQTMWNAVDEWVIRSSKFHSLLELYGHFTEPHPIFEIVEFQVLSSNAMVAFARHCADFRNCSRYFPRKHLTDLFGLKDGRDEFARLVSSLRQHRFDIRCHETNLAIPQDVYMVAYPFTLPLRKQMNFSVKHRAKDA